MAACRIIIGLLTLLWCAATHVAVAATPVGETIENQATMTYLHIASGTTVEVLSNVSRLTVSASKQHTLTQSQALSEYAGNSVTLTHELTNVGNVKDFYVVSALNSAADGDDLQNLFVYIDVNANGEIDASEPVVDAPIELDPDESVLLIVSGVVPSAAVGDSTIEVIVSASSEGLDNPLTNTDTITVIPEALIDITLTNSPDCGVEVSTNTPIDYSVKAINRSVALPNERTITLDGEEREGVLISLDLPPEFTLVKSQLLDVVAFQAIPIVQLSDDDDFWRRYEHWSEDLPNARIALLVPAENFVQGELIEFAFAARGVSVPENDGIATLQAVVDIDGDSQSDFSSNVVCNEIWTPLAAIEAKLEFVEPILELQRNGEAPDFSNDESFSGTPVYSLSRSNGIDRNRELFIGYDVTRDGVYVELVSDVSDDLLVFDEAGVAHTIVDLESLDTGDSLRVVVRQTAADSRTYRSIRPILLSPDEQGAGAFCPEINDTPQLGPASYENGDDHCTLNSDVDDTINISFNDPNVNFSLFDSAIVDPTSVVFDSTSLQSVPNATVYLKQGDSVALHPITDNPIVFRTDESGQFSLPRLLAGNDYHIFVEPPNAYVYPSVVPSGQFNTFNVNEYSYGLNSEFSNSSSTFSVARDEAPPVIDIPLDPVDVTALLAIEKRALSETVEPGDIVIYTADITNNSTGVLTELSVVDTPPFGFRFIPGSVTLQGEAFADPNKVRVSHDDGRLLSENYAGEYISALLFELEELGVGETQQLQYQLQATPAALQGDGINSVVVSGASQSGVIIASNPSRVQVQMLRSGVLSDDAIVFGKVYVDSTCDLIQNHGEWPIAGVRLYLQDGSYVITDEDGQYSLYGLKPGTQVIRIDPLTMPEDVFLKPLDTRHAADPTSRFLTLSPGDFHRADFATGCPQTDSVKFFQNLKERNRNLRGDWLLDGAVNFNPDGGSPQITDLQRAAPDGDLAAGTIGGVNNERIQTAAVEAVTKGSNLAGVFNNDTDKEVLPSESKVSAKLGNPKELVETITNEQSLKGTWLWPEKDISKDGRFMAVIRAGIDPVLYVNNEAVDESKIGERIINRREQAQIVAWYGVKLLPGANQVEIRGIDAFSNERILASGLFKQPSSGVRLMLSAEQDTLYADGGRSVLPIDISVVDRHGYPANGVYFVTLDTTLGEFVEADLQVHEPGLQVRVENGRGRVHVQSVQTTGNFRVSAATGSLSDSIDLVSIADLRPLFGVGLLELGGRYQTADEGADNRANLDRGFETEERLALFLKGRVRNNLHLTLAYDSERSDETDLLQNLNPNEQYPTFGDASVRGFEAQSRSKLYAKLEKDRHSVMWGDYVTDSFSDVDSLGRVQRTLTGANAVYDNGRTRLQVFAAEQSDSRGSEEIRGNGTAMLFQVAGAPIVANSEVVERIVRHRDNPGLVLATTPLQRYVDYTIDHISGLMAFTEPVPSFDSNGHSVYIRVSYDREDGGDEYLVSGLRLQHEFSESTLAGISLTDDQNPITGYTLSSVFVKSRLGINTVVVASQAFQSHQDNRANGFASFVEINHQWGGRRDHRTKMTWARASNTFDNSSASVSSGREELRLEHSQSISNTVKMTAEYLSSEETNANVGYTSSGIRFDKTDKDWTYRLGARHLRSYSTAEKYRFNTILLGAERRFRFGDDRQGSIGFDVERDISDSSRFSYGIYSRVQLHDRVTLYGRYERDHGIAARSLLSGQQKSSLFTLGIESDVSPQTRVFSEYRMRSSFSGTSVESASGIRGQYQIRPGLTVSPALEIINGIKGADATDSIALSVGFSDTRNPNRKLNAQAEVRDTDTNTYYGFRGTLAQRLNQDWTALIREEFVRQNPDSGEFTSRHRFTLGLARRPKLNNRHHSLYLANWKEDYGPEAGMDKTTYVLSTHQNRQINAQFGISGRAGAKWQSTRYDVGEIDTKVFLSDVRGTFDFKRRWEFDVRAGWLGTDGLGEGQYSYGLGLAWLVDRNARLGVAYNFVGFRDDDLDEQGYNAQGVHFGLQIKFDEDWFRWLED